MYEDNTTTISPPKKILVDQTFISPETLGQSASKTELVERTENGTNETGQGSEVEEEEKETSSSPEKIKDNAWIWAIVIMILVLIAIYLTNLYNDNE